MYDIILLLIIGIKKKDRILTIKFFRDIMILRYNTTFKSLIKKISIIKMSQIIFVFILIFIHTVKIIHYFFGGGGGPLLYGGGGGATLFCYKCCLFS